MLLSSDTAQAQRQLFPVTVPAGKPQSNVNGKNTSSSRLPDARLIQCPSQIWETVGRETSDVDAGLSGWSLGCCHVLQHAET